MKKQKETTVVLQEKYQDPKLGWMPTTYTGGESVTFPNGLIFKQGSVEVKANETVDVSYEVAFPNDVKTTQANGQGVSAVAKAGKKKRVLQLSNLSRGKRNVNWQAWGY